LNQQALTNLTDPQTATAAKAALQELADPKRARHGQLFFKTGPGHYGEGDIFIGVSVPNTRSVAARFKDLPEDEVAKLAHSGIHEHRLLAAIVLSLRFHREKDVAVKAKQFEFYMKLAGEHCWNNWDLVDTSAPYFGLWLVNHPDDQLLNRLVHSDSLWDRRIAIMLTFAHIRAGVLEPTLRLARILNTDEQDLIHKAVGWMLRELGKQDNAKLLGYLDETAATMPRTMLRYALEKQDEPTRKHYMGLAALAGNR
jgi:3-methyladenine DNA glycosylase AlkD